MEKGYQTQWDLALNMEKLVREAGFVDIKRRVDKVPWSPWHPPGTKEHRTGQLFERFCEHLNMHRHLWYMIADSNDRSDGHPRVDSAAVYQTSEGKSHNRGYKPAVH